MGERKNRERFRQQASKYLTLEQAIEVNGTTERLFQPMPVSLLDS